MAIEFVDVNYNYTSQIDTLIFALKSINLKFEDNEFISIVGHTGCGKTTLAQNINALLQPTSGVVIVNDFEISDAKIKNVYNLRKKVGMAFQFAENQLFEETILKDVMFGPINFGYSKEEAEKLAKESLEIVGISEELFERSPHELSGGQMRRVAIAGILAYQPEILILDEPTAGLDPLGQLQMMQLFKKLHASGKTVIMISHNFNDVFEYSERVVMLSEGEVVFDGAVHDFFAKDIIETENINFPDVLRVAEQLKINEDIDDYNQLVDWIVNNYGK